MENNECLWKNCYLSSGLDLFCPLHEECYNARRKAINKAKWQEEFQLRLELANQMKGASYFHDGQEEESGHLRRVNVLLEIAIRQYQKDYLEAFPLPPPPKTIWDQ